MSRTTQYYELVVPEASDPIDISVLGGDLDTIDQKLHDLDNKGTDNYAYTESETNERWVDGNIVYQRVFSIGALSNNKDIYVQIDNFAEIDTVIQMFGSTQKNDAKTGIEILPIERSDIHVSLVKTDKDPVGKLVVRPSNNKTTYTKTYIVLKYTKVQVNS